jgi:phage terminase large subunit-like protein
MASNLMWEKDAADNWKPSKRKSREKIDGITALIMALGMGMALSGGQGPSIEDALLSGDGVLA